MTCHFGLKDELDGMVLRNHEKLADSRGTDEESLESELDRSILLKTIMHVCDISNPCKPWIVSKQWAIRVFEEFMLQGDKEKMANLPVSPNFDRGSKLSHLQVNFVDYIVGPFFVALTNVIPKVHECCENMLSNRSEWHRVIELEIMEDAALDETHKIEETKKWLLRQIKFKDVMDLVLKEHGDVQDEEEMLAEQDDQISDNERLSDSKRKSDYNKRRKTLQIFETLATPIDTTSTEAAVSELERPSEKDE